MLKIIKWFLIFIFVAVTSAYLYMYFTGVVYYLDVKKMVSDYFDESKSPEIIVTDSNDSNIIVTPVMDTKIDINKNMIYCATVQMALNKLTECTNETLEVLNAPDYLSKMNLLIDQLPPVSEDAYVAMAGIADMSTSQKIKDTLKEKFGNLLSPNELNIDLKIKPGNIYAFSFLFKNLMFKKEFKEIDRHLFKFNNKKVSVKAFGVEPYVRENDAFIKQCEVFYDHKKNAINFNEDFVIKIKSKSESDEIIISNFKPEETFEKTFKSINAYISNPEKCDSLDKNFYLRIPKVNFNINMHYNRMCNKILNRKYKELFIQTVFQKIKFNLNEKGVYLISYALIESSVGLRKGFVIDRPFFIYLKDKTSSKPYFMAYIADDRLLINSDEKGVKIDENNR